MLKTGNLEEEEEEDSKQEVNFYDEISELDEGADYYTQRVLNFGSKSKDNLMTKDRLLLNDECKPPRLNSMMRQKFWLSKYFEAVEASTASNERNLEGSDGINDSIANDDVDLNVG